MAEEYFDFITKSSTNNAIYEPTKESLIDSNKELTVGGHFVNLKIFWLFPTNKFSFNKLEFYGVKGKLDLLFGS